MTTGSSSQDSVVTVFTIGFTKKTAREFFDRLQEAGVKKVLDIRLGNESQLAGFTKKDDLAFFLQAVAGISYSHRPDLAPTRDLLDDYKERRITWADYEQRFCALLRERRADERLTPLEVDKACLLCSEPKPDKCHRRLLAEYLRSKWGSVLIRHL